MLIMYPGTVCLTSLVLAALIALRPRLLLCVVVLAMLSPVFFWRGVAALIVTACDDLLRRMPDWLRETTTEMVE
jgi:hypothetical protein